MVTLEVVTTSAVEARPAVALEHGLPKVLRNLSAAVGTITLRTNSCRRGRRGGGVSLHGAHDGDQGVALDTLLNKQCERVGADRHATGPRRNSARSRARRASHPLRDARDRSARARLRR
jgi:hypothetical protein